MFAGKPNYVPDLGTAIKIGGSEEVVKEHLKSLSEEKVTWKKPITKKEKENKKIKNKMQKQSRKKNR